MKTEIEAKWLDIDIDEMRKKLKEIGAELVMAERVMRRTMYDFPDKALEKKNGWSRVRDEGNAITMSYKQLDEYSVSGMKEVCLTIDSYDNACLFYESLGMVIKSRQENRRESWKLGDVEIEIDTWPWIPTLVEIEAQDEDELYRVAEKLGLDRKKGLHGGIEPAFQDVYDVTWPEIFGMKEIKFTDIPEWLEGRRKK